METTARKVGWGMIGAATVGVAAHFAGTMIKEVRINTKDGENRVLETYDGVRNPESSATATAVGTSTSDEKGSES